MKTYKQYLVGLIIILSIILFPVIVISEETETKSKAIEFLKKINFSIGINGGGGTAGLDKLGEELKNAWFYPVGLYMQGDTIIIPDTRLEFSLNYIRLFGRNSDDIKMSLFPMNLSLIYKLPFSLGIDTYVKAGGGFVYEIMTTQKRERFSNNPTKYLGEEMTESNNPLFIFGIGSSLNIVDWLVLKSEVVYNFIYEKYIAEALENGHFIYFNLGIAYQIK